VADTTIRAIIKLLVEGGHIPKEVATQIKGVGTESAKAKPQVASFSAAAKDLGSMLRNVFGALGITFAASAVANWLRDAWVGFARTERQARVVENQIRAIGQATEGAGFRKFIADLSDTTGILDDDLVPAFQRAITTFRDYKASQEVVSMAARFAAAGIGDVAQNVQALTTFFQTGSARGLKPFISNLKEGEDGTINLEEGLAQLRSTLASLGPPLNDAQSRVLTLRTAWDGIKDTAGGVVDELLHMATSWRYLTETLDPTGIIRAKNALKDLKEQRDTEVYGPIKPSPEQEALDREARERQKNLDKKALDEKAAAEQRAREEQFDAESQSLQQVLQLQIDGTKEGTAERLALEKKLIDERERYDVEHARRAGISEAGAHEAAAQDRANREKDFAEKRLAAAEAEIDALLQVQFDGAREGSEGAFLIEMEILRRRYEKAIKAADDEGRDTARIRLAWEQEVANKTLAFIEQRKQAEIEAAQAVIDAERELQGASFEQRLILTQEQGEQWYAIQREQADADHENRVDDIYRQMDAEDEAFRKGDTEAATRKAALVVQLKAEDVKYASGTKELARSEKEYKQQQYLAAAQTAVGALRTLFGDKKAFAIAETVINTAQGVSQALTLPFPLNFIVAALVAAAGLKQVMTIRSTNPGGGGSISVGASGGGVAAAGATPASSAGTATASPIPGAPAGSGPKAIGQGFDDPAHDRAAYLGGRRWAEDFVRNTESGWREGLRTEEKGRPAMSPAPAKFDREAVRAALSGPGSTFTAGARAGGPSSDAQEIVAGITKALEPLAASTESREPKSVDQSVTINGNLYGGDEGMRQLSRELDRARRLDGNRTIS
jgi:hypothetical protein